MQVTLEPTARLAMTPPDVHARILELEAEAMNVDKPAPVRKPKSEVRLSVLDGVRGLAIAMVVAVHVLQLPATGPACKLGRLVGHFGWAGVDLFFVLSGFLITGILYDTKGGPKFFRNFYARRALRIFPLYYAFVAFCLLAVPHIPHLTDYTGPMQAGHSSWSYWFYFSNFTTAFAGADTHGLLDVLWSLSVEEHFYFIWPLLIFFCSRERMMKLCVWTLVFSAVLRTSLVVFTKATWLEMYMLTPCRIDALAVGGLVALLARGPGGMRALQPLAIKTMLVGGLITVACMIKHKASAFTGGPGQAIGYTGVDLCFGSLLVLLLNSRPTAILHELFDSSILTLLGRYSYAIYLFHRGVYVCLERWFCQGGYVRPICGSFIVGQVAFYVATVAVSVGLALISWNLLEKHFLKLKHLFAAQPKAKPAPVVEAPVAMAA